MDSQHTFAIPRTLKWRDREVKFSFTLQKIKALMVAWVKDRDFAEITAMADRIPEASYDKLLADHLARCRRGEYEFGTDAYAAAVEASPDAQTYYISLLTGLSMEDTLQLLLEKQAEVQMLIEELNGVVEKKLMGVQSVPPTPSPSTPNS